MTAMTATQLDPLRVLEARQGFFTRAQAGDAGYDDGAVTVMARRRWHRFRRGYYAHTDTWQALDEQGQHRVRAHAVLHSLGDAVALSHVSGVLEHGIAVWGLDLSRVHVTRLDGGAGRIEKDVVHHEGRCLEGDVLAVDGRAVLRPERCVIEAGSRATQGQALVMADSLLHLHLADREQLEAQFARMARWPFVQSMHLPVRLADARADSPGESLGRHLFWAAGLPAPDLQHDVRDAAGRLVGTADWAWPEHGLLGEFDGKVKYGRLLREGESPGDAVFREKQREDRMREASGNALVRLVWADLFQPAVTAARVTRLMRQVG